MHTAAYVKLHYNPSIVKLLVNQTLPLCIKSFVKPKCKQKLLTIVDHYITPYSPQPFPLPIKFDEESTNQISESTCTSGT